MKMLLCLLLLLVACDDEEDSSASSGDENDNPVQSYSLKVSVSSEEVYRDSKLTVTAEILNDDQLVKEGAIAESEIALVIICGKHNIGKERKKNSTKGKVSFADIEVSGENFNGKCSATVSATIDGENISDSSDFTVSEPPPPPPNTSLSPSEKLQDPPELTIADRITVGQPINISVPTSFSGGVKIQPRIAVPPPPPSEEGEETDGSTKACPNYFLIHHDGNRLTEVLTNGVVITANNGKLEGLVLISKGSSSTNCKLTLATTDKNH